MVLPLCVAQMPYIITRSLTAAAAATAYARTYYYSDMDNNKKNQISTVGRRKTAARIFHIGHDSIQFSGLKAFVNGR